MRTPNNLSGSERDGFKMSGHGGARNGAGRQAVRLTDLVLERRFNRQNQRHRSALLKDEVSLHADARAQGLQRLVE